jgi:hypothetical protein
VVVDDLNPVCVSVSENKADSELIVDPDTVLSFSVASERFEPIARRSHEVFEPTRPM